MISEPGNDSDAGDLEFDIAIVGYAGRFPGAKDVESFWQNLAAGVESVSWFTPDELADAGVPIEIIDDPRFVRAAPILEGADLFDAKFFGYSPREAKLMDPQQRLLLESAQTAMEHGGYDPATYHGRIGVFAGTAMNTYILNAGVASQFTTDYLPTLLGNDKDFLATRIAYKLGLNGPAMTIQTACSTSLVALHVASQSLLNRETDMALVGAMAIRVPQASGHLYEEGSVFTPDGHCRTFDAKANGTLFGSGGGMVLIKRLSDAIADGDTVHAVVRGTAVNNDGSTKSDFTAPSVTTQAEAITEALGAADVDASTVSYIEAHGTGTYLGDPIEVEALTRAFRNDTEATQYCGIGSVKPNIGHLDAAAGIAGLLKVVKAFEHKQLPPTINFESPNPQIDFPSTPFKVVDKLIDWEPVDGSPRRAGLTSLGMGGTNAHVILEEPPQPPVDPTAKSEPKLEVLVLSARNADALQTATMNLAGHMEGAGSNQPLADIAHTLQIGRRHHSHRRSLVATSHAEAASILRGEVSGALSTTSKQIPRSPVFVFPGGGMQHPKMGKGLYETDDLYRKTIDECAGYAQSHLGLDIRDVIFGEGESGADLDRTDMFMPAMFATCYANALMWMAKGIEPIAMAGHSLGEYVAATVAGVFSPADAVRLVIRRGQLGRSVSGGTMLALAASQDQVRPFLVPGAEISVVNGPLSCVVSGTLEAVDQLEEILGREGIEGRRLRLQEAYHCSMLDPILDDFAKDVADVVRNPPQIPVASNISGTWLTDEEATSVDYWVQHLRRPVRFDQVFTAVSELGDVAILEAGPNQSMVSMVRQHPALAGVPAIPSSRRYTDETPDEIMAARALGKLWEAGVPVDFATISERTPRRRVPLPTYPFQSERFWFESKNQTPVISDHEPVEVRVTDASEWIWQIENRVKTGGPARQGIPTVVIGANSSEAGKAILLGLVSAGVEVQSIETPSVAGRIPALSGSERHLHVIDLLALSPPSSTAKARQGHLDLIRVLGNDDSVEIDLSVVVDSSSEALDQAAAATGPALVAGKEYSHLRSRLIEANPEESSWLDPLIQELLTRPNEAVVTISDQTRSVRSATQIRIPNTQLPPGGTYLITGGLSGIGLALAEHLVANRGSKVALVARRSVPEPSTWAQAKPEDDNAELIAALRSMGSENVLVFSADVTDANAMDTVFDEVAERFGKLDGVFHSAGAIDDRLIALRDETVRSAEVIDPKVKGSRILYEGLARSRGGFLALFSSMNSFLAPPGQVDYVSANSFMDRFAQQHDNEVHVVSIAWPAWRDVGIIARMTGGQVKDRARNRGIDSVDGFALLERLVLSGISHAIVSPVRFDNELSAAQAAQLRAQITEAPQSKAADSVSGLNPIESKVAGYFRDLLGVDDPQLDDSFFDLGGTSLVAVKLFNRIEADFGVSLTLDTMVDASTVQTLGAVLASNRPDMLGGPGQNESGASQQKPVGGPAGSKSLVRLRAGGDKQPIYMVHGHGGNVIGLIQLGHKLDAGRPIYGLQSIGLNGGSELDLSMEAMASRYLAEIKAVQPEGPYVLSGYCMGGVIAFEMAQQLVAAGEDPPTLIMLDAYPQEHLIRVEAQTSRAARALSLAASRLGREKVHRQNHDSLFGYLRQRLNNATEQLDGGVETATRQQRRLDRVADANYDAYFAYVAKPYPGTLALVRPERRVGHVDPDPALGWSEFATGVDVRYLCKYRYDMFVEPGLSRLANVMNQLLPQDP